MIFEPMDRIVFAGDSVTDMGSAQPVGEGLFDNVGPVSYTHLDVYKRQPPRWHIRETRCAAKELHPCPDT